MGELEPKEIAAKALVYVRQWWGNLAAGAHSLGDVPVGNL